MCWQPAKFAAFSQFLAAYSTMDFTRSPLIGIGTWLYYNNGFTFLLLFPCLASELQSWLLYYALPCLVGFLPDKYLHHFACFSEAIYVLLGSGITPVQLGRARDLLNKFYKDFQALYGMMLQNTGLVSNHR